MNTEEIQTEISSLQRELRDIKRRLNNYEGGFADLVELFKVTMLAVGSLAIAVAQGLKPDDPVLTRASKAMERLRKTLPSISGDA